MSDVSYMRIALRIARRGYGVTSPNPMVGAVLVKGGKILGRGWHRRAGLPHAEIEALRDAEKRGHNARGATLYVTLEPCCTHGRTPPCTEAITAAGIRRVIVGTIDPNPKHAGKGLKILKRAGVEVEWLADEPKHGSPGASSDQKIAEECLRLNEAFNHWIVHHTPFVTVKAAMTVDGKIATVRGESKWITCEQSRAFGMNLRQGSDAIVVGVNTVLADDPSLTSRCCVPGFGCEGKRIRRIVLDSMARTPLKAKVVNDEFAALTTIVVSGHAPKKRVAALAKRVNVIVAPVQIAGRAVPCPPRRARSDAPYQISLAWLLRKLGVENVTSLLVEGGGEVNASFLLGGLAHRVVFFYAPKILGGQDARKGVAGTGVQNVNQGIRLCEVKWRKIGSDLLLTARADQTRLDGFRFDR